MEKIWKKCEICDVMFEASRATQRFCKECGKNTAIARRRMASAEIINRCKVGDLYREPRQSICKECGKEFFVIHSTSYCSPLCQYTARTKETKCIICGKNLFNLGIESSVDIPCSEKCKEIYELQKAKESGRYKKCKHCGEYFIASRKEGKYCCRECYLKDIQERRDRRNAGDFDYSKEELDEPIKRTCKYCGNLYVLSDSWVSEVFCSSSCRDKAKPKVIKHISPCKAVEENNQRKEREKKERERKEESRSSHLCMMCKTSQSECERFRSKFIYFPKGAIVKRVRGKEIVVECPKFS